MATVIRERKQRKSCPVCGTLVEEFGLAKAGLTKEQLQILKRHRDNQTLGHLIHLVDIFANKMNADQALQESDLKNAITQLEKIAVEVKGDVTEVVKRLAGTAVGKVGETITIKDLASLFKTDEFIDEYADKKGPDIIGVIKENEKSLGTVVISVKYDVQWKNEHLVQIRKNMKQIGTSFGLLVTKDFPKDALNEKAYVKTTKAGEMLMLVKPEYVAVAYYGFRQAVIAWQQASTVIKNEQDRIKEHQRISKVFIEWLSGKGFRQVIEGIDGGIEKSEEKIKQVELIESYLGKNFSKMKQDLKELGAQLREARSAIMDLKEMLNKEKGVYT